MSNIIFHRSVPLSCCLLANRFEKNSFLDPIAINEKLCQSIDPQDFQKSRYYEGCIDKIEHWCRDQYIILLCAGLLLTVVEFFVLLSIVINCTGIKQNQLSQKITAIKFINEEQSSSGQINSVSRNMARENIYQDEFISVTPEMREIFVQPKDLNNHKYPPTKFSRNNYRFSDNGYLI